MAASVTYILPSIQDYIGVSNSSYNYGFSIDKGGAVTVLNPSPFLLYLYIIYARLIPSPSLFSRPGSFSLYFFLLLRDRPTLQTIRTIGNPNPISAYTFHKCTSRIGGFGK